MMKFNERLTIIVCFFGVFWLNAGHEFRFSAKISYWCCLAGCCSTLCSHTHTKDKSKDLHPTIAGCIFWFLRFFSSNLWFLFIENTKLAHVFPYLFHSIVLLRVCLYNLLCCVEHTCLCHSSVCSFFHHLPFTSVIFRVAFHPYRYRRHYVIHFAFLSIGSIP